MGIEVGDTVVLNSKHIMKGTTVKIVGEIPPPWATMWEAVVVGGTAKTWVIPEQIERKL